MAPKTAVAPKQKQTRTYDELYRDLFDTERLVPGLAFEQETLRDLQVARLEKAVARVRACLDAEKPLEAALEEMARRNALDAEQDKVAAALRKAREATQEAASRVEALERAIPQQEALIKAKWGQVITSIRTAYEPEYRQVVGELGAAAIRLAELVAKETALRDTACAQLRRAARGAGLNPEAVGPGMPAMGGMWERQVGELRHPSSNVSFWLREARKHGYDVGETER